MTTRDSLKERGEAMRRHLFGSDDDGAPASRPPRGSHLKLVK